MPVPNRFPLPLWGSGGANAGGDGLQGFLFPNPTGPEAARLLDGTNRAIEKHAAAVEQLARAIRELPVEKLGDMGPGLRELAAALAQAPPAVAREVRAVKSAFDAGLTLGILVGVTASLFLLALFGGRQRA